MFTTLLLSIKNWLLTDGKGVVIVGVIILAWAAWIVSSKNSEIAKYRQTIEIIDKANAAAMDIVKKSYESQIKELMVVNEEYIKKMTTLVTKYTTDMEQITIKQEELIKTYSTNMDVLKLALKEVFAMEEAK